MELPQLPHEQVHESLQESAQEFAQFSEQESQQFIAQLSKAPIIDKTTKIPTPITIRIGKAIAKTPISTLRLRFFFLASSSSINSGSIVLPYSGLMFISTEGSSLSGKEGTFSTYSPESSS